jgi:hypothetical protein
VNYEDRTDLLPPERVLSRSLLSRLRRAPEAARLMTSSCSDPSSVAVNAAAYEAILQRVVEDTAPDRGAPPEARAVEEDAMLCGYRFGRLALGPLPHTRMILAEDLRIRTDSMYLYDLFVWDASTPDARVPIRDILIRHGVAHIHALEEAGAWAWAFGLGVALVETDLSAS